jgi:Bifunctional DNA primase/polymerase, N-terminal
MSIGSDRLLMRANGYTPTPCTGKRPVLSEWQKRHDPTDLEMAGWLRAFPTARNTGILARNTPALDIDIFDEGAAQAVEDLTREWFEELGWVLVRGREGAPKRLIPFRCDDPFEKQAITFAPRLDVNGKPVSEKLEFLGDGQQFVAYGTHPDTGLPYKWEGRSPLDTPREALPYIHRWEARDLINAAAKLLVGQFGYRFPEPPPAPAIPARPAKPTPRPSGAAYARNVENKLYGIGKRLEFAIEGERNAVLFWAACRIGELVNVGAVHPEFGQNLLILAATRAGLPATEARRTIASAMRVAA